MSLLTSLLTIKVYDKFINTNNSEVITNNFFKFYLEFNFNNNCRLKIMRLNLF